VETCDDQGSFDFTDVRAYGRPIWVKAQDAGGKWAVQVEVDPDSPRAVLRLAEAGRVAGRVVDQAGRPLADAEVAAYVEMASGLTRQCGAARTDASGTYRIDGLMTGCRGYVHVRKSGYARKSSEKRRFESGPVMQFEPLVVLKADSSIAGLVADTGGNPLKGARLLCTAPGPYFRRAVADSRGRYRIDGLPDVGSLTVEAQHPGSRPARRDQVKAGSTDINFVLEPAIR